MDEREAVERLKAGDPYGLEPLVRAYQLRAVRTAYLITRDRYQAEDIVQEAFVRSFERIAQLRPGASFGPWFLRIVANDALKAAARGQRLRPFPAGNDGLKVIPDVADANAEPERAFLERESRNEIWAALGNLSSERRSLLVLRYYLEWREPELAEWLGIPLGTIKWRLHDARRELRRLLDARYPKASTTSYSEDT